MALFGGKGGHVGGEASCIMKQYNYVVCSFFMKRLKEAPWILESYAKFLNCGSASIQEHIYNLRMDRDVSPLYHYGFDTDSIGIWTSEVGDIPCELW